MRCDDPSCRECEERLQPYLDRVLSDAERAEAEAHLSACADCGNRYRFEEDLRKLVHDCSEPMPPGLKERLRSISRSSHL